MHTEIKYQGTEAEKQEKALADCREWLGEARFNLILSEFRKLPKAMKPEQFWFYISIAGISGYPVEVLYKHIWPGAEWSWDFLEEGADE